MSKSKLSCDQCLSNQDRLLASISQKYAAKLYGTLASVPMTCLLQRRFAITIRDCGMDGQTTLDFFASSSFFSDVSEIDASVSINFSKRYTTTSIGHRYFYGSQICWLASKVRATKCHNRASEWTYVIGAREPNDALDTCHFNQEFG